MSLLVSVCVRETVVCVFILPRLKKNKREKCVQLVQHCSVFTKFLKLWFTCDIFLSHFCCVLSLSTALFT